MAKRKDAEDWLEWAQQKYDAAQERYAWSERADSSTMDSYSTLVSLIERGMSSYERDRADIDRDVGAAESLLPLAEQMETLGKNGFAYGPSGMVEAARTIKEAFCR